MPRVMELAEFERSALAYFHEIPPEFRERVTGPVVVAGHKGHKRVKGLVTLGECVHAPRWNAEDPLSSTVMALAASTSSTARRSDTTPSGSYVAFSTKVCAIRKGPPALSLRIGHAHRQRESPRPPA